MERKFVLTEGQLRELLVDALEHEMMDRDGVDNWAWYGESYREVVRDNHPYNLSLDEVREHDISFEDCAQAMMDAGIYPELTQFDI